MERNTTSPPPTRETLQNTTPNLPSIPQTFPFFPLLPTEIRLKIWSYASRFPRALELQYCIISKYFFSFQHLPSVLHTSHESRTVGLTHYHLSFSTTKNPANTYFNPHTDIIYFGSRQYNDETNAIIEHFRKNVGTLEERDQIQNVAMAEYLWRRDRKGQPFSREPGGVRDFYRAFPELKKLIFVKGLFDPDEVDQGNGDFEAAWELYTGISLVESEIDQTIIENSNFALREAIEFSKSRKRRYPNLLHTKIIAMDYGFS